MARHLLLLLSSLAAICKCFTWSLTSLSARRDFTIIHSSSCSSQTNYDDDDAPITSTNLSQLQRRFQKYRTSPYHAPHIERVLLLSDLHCDYAENREWLSNLTLSDENCSAEQTMILIAGDVSHDLQILRWTFQTLKQTFAEVAFVPGNHELWLDKGSAEEGDQCADSIDKLERILQLCLEEDIHIGPVKVNSLWIVPLLSWHHLSFDTEPQICSESWAGIPTASRTVRVGADYRKTVWPHPITPLDDSVAQFMDGLNDVLLDLDNIDDEWGDDDDATIVTFSHFLPRVELLPEKRYLSLPTLPACSGSTFLESRLRELNENLVSKTVEGEMKHLHAFGHSHLAYDLTIEDVRYVHVPLAYPREWEQRRRSLEIGTMAGHERHRRFPVSIWEKNTNFPSESLGGWWSKYYTIMQRQPHRTKELAPWVARRFKQRTSAAVVEDFDHVKMEMMHKLHHPSYWNVNGTWYAEKQTMKQG